MENTRSEVVKRYSVKKGVLKNFTKFIGKHVCQSLSFNKVAGLACNFIKKATVVQAYLCEFFDIFKNTSSCCCLFYTSWRPFGFFDSHSCVVNIAETRFKEFSVGPSLIELFH